MLTPSYHRFDPITKAPLQTLAIRVLGKSSSWAKLEHDSTILTPSWYLKLLPQRLSHNGEEAETTWRPRLREPVKSRDREAKCEELGLRQWHEEGRLTASRRRDVNSDTGEWQHLR
ncbi:hypothetical protein PIB30_042725 [Stylosanthes scabra]|uniref:Uncharacterized protein n=1 Tax=Stylosanthes scabra TaxID=79078 RepID=A0ABU6QGU3_9FABA|nr:hypothetical protein [Stylosanthes scabra]